MRINACELMNEAKKNPAAYEGKQYKVTIGGIVTFLGKEAKTFEIWHGAFSLDKTGTTRLYVSDNTEVEEVQQPIPFMEAVKAYSEGKTEEISCELDGDTNTYNYKKNKSVIGHGAWLRSDRNTPVSTEQILRGKWFVKWQGESTNE